MLGFKNKIEKSFTLTTICIVVLALIAAFLLYPRSSESEKGKKTIVIWVPRSKTDSIKKSVEEFERRNPEYQVQVGSATVRDAVGDPTRFLLGVAGNVPPDLIYFDRFAIVEWASRGAFFPLNEYLKRDKALPDAISQANYVAPAWNEATYKGKQYAVPNSVDNRALFYNKNLLIRAGFVYEKNDPEVRSGHVKAGDAKPPKSWNELCRKRIDSKAKVMSNGKVVFGAGVNLVHSGVAKNDVITILSGDGLNDIFRARVQSVVDSTTLLVDFEKELAPGTQRVASEFTGNVRVKIFDRNSYIVKLTRFDSYTGSLKTAGFIPFFGNSWLYMYGWLNGGKFMSSDGRKCTLDDPRIVEALQYIIDMYDCLGGVEEARIFQSSGMGSSMLDLFLNNKIAMKIEISWFMQTISSYKPNMSFGVVPAPLPDSRIKAGGQPVSWMGGWSYAIPSTAKNKDDAWKLMKWLCSLEANKIRAEFESTVSKSKGQVYFPRLSPEKRFNKYLYKKYIKSSPAISKNLKNAYSTMIYLLDYCKYRPVTPVGQKLWNEHKRAASLAIGHSMTAKEALDNGCRQVQISLNRILNPPDGPTVPWLKLIVLYCLAILAWIVFMILRNRRKKQANGYRRNKWYEGYICVSPWLLGFFTFGAGSIVFSIVISFTSYDVLSPAKFIGLDNYRNLVADPIFWLSIRNTCFMIISVPLSIIAGIALALLLNHSLRGMQLYRTLFYLPAIVPMVAALLLWMKVFDPRIGFINQLLITMGVDDPPAWLSSPVWAKPSIIIMSLWGVGGSMVIWLAGLKNIPETLYEAAAIDGAGPIRRFTHITLPMLTPYIFFNLVMGMIGIFQIFEQAYIMTNGGPEDATLFYAYKLFNEAFRYLNFGTASAMAWLLFFVVLVITLFNFWLGKKWVHYGD